MSDGRNWKRSKTDSVQSATIVLHFCEVDEAVLGVGSGQFGFYSVAYVEALGALCQEAFDSGLEDADESSFGSHAGDHGVEGFSDVRSHGDG